MRRPKGIKTKKSVAKRFKITGTGKVMRSRAGKRHLLQTKENAKLHIRRSQGLPSRSIPLTLTGLSRTFRSAINLNFFPTCVLQILRLRASAASAQSRRPRASASNVPSFIVTRPTPSITGWFMPIVIARPRSFLQLPRALAGAHQRRRPRRRHDLQPFHGRLESRAVRFESQDSG